MTVHMQVSKYSSSESLESLQSIKKITSQLEEEISFLQANKTKYSLYICNFTMRIKGSAHFQIKNNLELEADLEELRRRHMRDCWQVK